MDIRNRMRLDRLVETGAARALREAAGLSLAEVAKGSGLHRVSVWRYEAGLRRPRGEAAARYLRALDEMAGVK